MLSEGQTSRVMVLPVKVLTKICMVNKILQQINIQLISLLPSNPPQVPFNKNQGILDVFSTHYMCYALYFQNRTQSQSYLMPIKSLIIYKILIYASIHNILITITMKYLAAYALLSLSGKKDITAADIKKVLGEVQANVSDDDLNRCIATLKGKSVQTLIADGLKKLGDAPAGAAPAKAGKTETKAKEVPKEAPKKEAPKKKEEPKVEEDDDMGLGGGLFD